MQRLARVNLEQQNVAAVELFGHYDEIVGLLNRHLPPSTASMLARPEVNDNVVEWYSELQGQPYLLGNTEREQATRKQAETLISQRLDAVDKLRTDLLQKGTITTEQAALLESLVEAAQHDSIQIYVVNKQPVIIGWGLGKKPMPVVPPALVAKKFRWWLWLLPLLLLGGLAWWLYFRPEPIQTEPVTPVKIEISKPEPKPEPPKEEPKLDPIKEEPKSEPVKEEPKLEPVKEESKPEPKKEVKKPEPVKEKTKEDKKPSKPKIDNSIAEKVKASGGNPNGDFRASLAWHNGEDLDLQLNTLNAHANKCSNGYAVLDVDMNGVGCGSKKRNFTSPVENIVAKHRNKMPNGSYVFTVEQFGAHQVPGGYMCKMLDSGHGFELQIKLNDRMRTYAYRKPIRDCQRKIKMLEVVKQGDDFRVVYVNPDLKLIADVTVPN
ncbi:hypothetical protein [Aggregatibacter aphrophilus]|uniref:Uncharacterized protein n=1 Tax=Aggregatibacter aphrophilus TaxID=732 RepID=A0AAP7L471_AGGAP|nr:hypothetical protein [Aggregatibacter aphrophilus]OBY52859.1 hypothetical protein BBB52_05875 [Aggregatibacter aphrophilus]